MFIRNVKGKGVMSSLNRQEDFVCGRLDFYFLFLACTLMANHEHEAVVFWLDKSTWVKELRFGTLVIDSETGLRTSETNQLPQLTEQNNWKVCPDFFSPGTFLTLLLQWYWIVCVCVWQIQSSPLHVVFVVLPTIFGVYVFLCEGECVCVSWSWGGGEYKGWEGCF